jgi:hypothetical protein
MPYMGVKNKADLTRRNVSLTTYTSQNAVSEAFACGRHFSRVGDFSSNWISSGLPTTRTSALTLYAS